MKKLLDDRKGQLFLLMFTAMGSGEDSLDFLGFLTLKSLIVSDSFTSFYSFSL